MPRRKKEIDLVNVGSVNTKNNGIEIQNDNRNSSITIPISKEAVGLGGVSLNSAGGSVNKFKVIGERGKLPFKKPNWTSKFRVKEKTVRTAKNIKTMVQDTLDSMSYNIYQNIEAGPTLLPKKKYCDITGFESNYTDPRTGLRYYNSEIYKIANTLSEPIKNQYLSIRKALFVIK